MLIDSESDSLVLIDFGDAYRIGVEKRGSRDSEGRWGERDDVKGVLLFLYEYITHDPALDEHYRLDMVNEKDFMDPAKWTKHPDVELDDEVAEFHFELMAWVRGRRRAGHQMKHYSEAPQPLEWPNISARAETLTFSVRDRRDAGLPFVDWRRPPASDVDPTRRLLATGQYADEEEALQGQGGQETRSPKGSRSPSADASSSSAATGNGSPSRGLGPNRWSARPDAGTRAAIPTAASGVRASPGTAGGRKRKHGDEPESNGSSKTATAADAGGPPKKLPRRSARLSANRYGCAASLPTRGKGGSALGPGMC